MSLLDTTDILCLANLERLLARATDTVGRYRSLLYEAHEKRRELQDTYRIYGHSKERLHKVEQASRVTERLHLLLREGEVAIDILKFSIEEAKQIEEEAKK